MNLMNICYDTNEDFNFNRISLGIPKSLQGGAHFSKLLIDGDGQFLFQTPKCFAIKGIVTTGKKTYTDLLFTNEHETFLKWFELLEKKAQNLIFDRRDDWFHNDMNMEDIEEFYNPLIRIYQGDN